MILLEISGGTLQRVVTDQSVKEVVVLMDWDNIKAGDSKAGAKFLVESMSPLELRELIRSYKCK